MRFTGQIDTISEYNTTLRYNCSMLQQYKRNSGINCYGKSLHVTVRGLAISESRNREVGYRNRGREMSRQFKREDEEGE